MVHDEVVNRDGQDPNACARETEEHYGERIRHYTTLLERMSANSDSGFVDYLEDSLRRYQGWLDGLIERKRSDGQSIAYEYAQPGDVVFVDGECPFTGGGTRYTKSRMLAVCMGDDVAARRLTEICLERGAKRFQKVEEGGYEDFAYNTSLAELRKAYHSNTIYNRVVLVHGAGKLTEIVFDKGLDHLIGDCDPVNDFDKWDRSLESVREEFVEFSRRTLGQEALLVRFSPSKNLARAPMPLFANTDNRSHDVADESLTTRLRTDLQLTSNDEDLKSELHIFAKDLLNNQRSDIRMTP